MIEEEIEFMGKMLKILVTFFILVSCGDETKDPHPEIDGLTIATNSANNKAVELTVVDEGTLYLPPDKKKYTEAIYADVDPSDNLKIIFLVDNSKEMAEHRKKLALEIDSFLKEVINSNWRIAVTTLGSQIFPEDIIAKNPDTTSYANAPDYEAKFDKAINNLRQATADRKTDDGLTVFIIVTNNDLDQPTEDSLNKLLAGSRDKLVFALLDTEDKHQGSSKYLDWRDSEDRQIIDRYGSINMENYQMMLEEFSQHTAEFLKRSFYLKGYYSSRYSGRGIPQNLRAYQQGEDLIMRIVVDPLTDLDGKIPNDSFDLSNRRILTDARLPTGMCLEIDYPAAE